jgi:type II secretory pathway component GspD/PulD (secretin)
MRKIVIMLISFLVLGANQSNKLTLAEFAKVVSDYNNVNVYIDEDINASIMLYVPDRIRSYDVKKLFEITLEKHDFNFKTLGQTYYISKKIPYSVNNHYYPLKFNTVIDCKNILEFYGIKHSFLKDSSTFLISATDQKFKEVKKLLDLADRKKEQVILKIMIFEYQDDDIKNRGINNFNYQSSISSDKYIEGEKNTVTSVNKFLSALVSPLSNSNLTFGTKDFSLALSFLDENKLIDVKQFPYILSRNNDKFVFKAVQNIPYQKSSTKTEASNTSTQTETDYKDIGLIIDGISFIYNDYVSLDLNLIIEDLISINNNMPQTYKREINSKSNVNYGDVLLLSGLKRQKTIKNDWSIPYLSNIPYFGEIFKYESESLQNLNIAIAIEVIKPDSFDFKGEIMGNDYFNTSKSAS